VKNGLIPSNERKEIAFVFDRNQIETYSYGFTIFSNLFPLFDRKSCNSILGGDYIGDGIIKDGLKKLLLENIITRREFNYIDNNQFFIVYINNLSEKMFETINDGLKDFNYYIGYFDITYSSILKSYFSTILNHLFLKNRSTIITGAEEDNLFCNYPVEENQYKWVSVPVLFFNLFLSYKVEREVLNHSDKLFSINAISEIGSDFSNFTLLIEEDKFSYLIKQKGINLERAGLANLTLQEFEHLVKLKISNNYIYNLSFLEEYKVIKFNVMIEIKRTDKNKSMKFSVSLEYKEELKLLRLITMF